MVDFCNKVGKNQRDRVYYIFLKKTKQIKLKTATLLAIFGAAFMTVSFGLELWAGYLAKMMISV